MTKKKSDDHDQDKEFVASSAGSEGHNVTEEDSEGEHTENDSIKVYDENSELFADSKSEKSVTNNLVTKKGDAKMFSDNKRKADSDDDNTDDGKKQKGDDKE